MLAAFAAQMNIEGLCSFRAINGLEGHNGRATLKDFFFWLHCPTELSHSFNLGHIFKITIALENLTSLTPVIQGVKYHDSRDLTGFVDGSVNPKDEHKYLESLIPEGQEAEKGS